MEVPGYTVPAAVLDYNDLEEDPVERYNRHLAEDKAIRRRPVAVVVDQVEVGSILLAAGSLVDSLDSFEVVVLGCNLVARKVVEVEDSHLVVADTASLLYVLAVPHCMRHIFPVSVSIYLRDC